MNDATAPIAAGPPRPPEGIGRLELWARLAYLLVLLLGFLVSIETMSKAIKALADTGLVGEGDELFRGVSNPFAGLALGVLFTVLVQSSSTTTSTIVAVVGSGALDVEHAIPMIMGANVGTTITNTLVSIGHVRRAAEFQRAFAAATVHDFFNLLAVAVMLPLELATGFLSRASGALAEALKGSGGSSYKSPLKAAIKSCHRWLESVVEGVGLEGSALSLGLLVLGIALTFLCLYQVTRNMRIVIAGRIEAALNRSLGKSGLVSVGAGVLITVAVQSSSITTSLLVPMAAAGVLSLQAAFPIMLGANIGTTVTALLASMAQDGSAPLTIALVHVLFNTIGVTVCCVFPAVRALPIRLAESLAALALRSRWWIAAYVVGVFVVLPAAGWFLWRDAA